MAVLLLMFTPIGMQVFIAYMVCSLCWLVLPNGVKNGIEGAGRNTWIAAIDAWRVWDTQCSMWTQLPSWYDK